MAAGSSPGAPESGAKVDAMENSPSAPPHAPATEGRRGRVLVVDDDPTVAEVVVGYLHRAGYAVERAGTGPQPWNGSRRPGPTSSSWT
ncbi:hypothetical protein SMICM17S_03457 [Streptomyces microflavus]